ncbi:MAG: hypothetical protein V1663_00930, partial [archaeon]
MKKEKKKRVVKNKELVTNKKEIIKNKEKLSIKNKISYLYNINKILFILTVVIFLIFLVIFSVKSYLYLSFFFGNDVLISLESDKNDLQLLNGQIGNVTISANVKSNPFCKVTCTYDFVYLGNFTHIENNTVILGSLEPLSRNYEIKADKHGDGQDLYRFDIECTGVKTLLCSTKDIPIRRSLVITMEYYPNEYELRLKDSLKKDIESLNNKLGLINSSLYEFQEALNEMNKTIVVDYIYTDLYKFQKNFSETLAYYQDLQNYWYTQDYSKINDEIIKINSINTEFNDLNKTITENVLRFNSIFNNLYAFKEDLDYVKKNLLYLDNSSYLDDLNKTFVGYNNLLVDVNNRDYISSKEILVNDFLYENDLSLIKEDIKKKSIEDQLGLLINYDSLCQISGICFDDYSIESIENENNYSLKEGCEAISSLREYYSDLNNSISLINYPTDVDFWNNISTKTNNVKNNLTDYYLNLLSPNSINHDIILSLLEQTPIVYTENYKYNLTNALLYKLIEQQPEECSLSDIQMNLNNMNLSKIIVNITSTPLNFNFEEQFSRCCVYGNCSECCLECYKNNYPVIFLH